MNEPNPVMDLQPVQLKNEYVVLLPLQTTDFERLYKVASDPLMWEQHPARDRYQEDVFQKFFDEAIASGSAFIVLDTQTNEPIGSSRYYEYDEANRSVAIGFTFLARKYWGTNYNSALKLVMLEHAFNFVDTVIFHVGEYNLRSQKAVEKLGAIKKDGMLVKEYGDRITANYIYEIDRQSWEVIKNKLQSQITNSE